MAQERRKTQAAMAKFLGSANMGDNARELLRFRVRQLCGGSPIFDGDRAGKEAANFVRVPYPGAGVSIPEFPEERGHNP